jgi:hypothetical protein
MLAWFVHLQLQSSNARLLSSTVNLKEAAVNLRLALVQIFWSWLPFPNLLPPYSYNLIKSFIIPTACILFVLASLIFWRIRKARIDFHLFSSGLPFVGMMVILAIAHMVVLVISYLFLLPPPILTDRLLVPVHIAITLGFLGICFFFARTWPKIKWLSWIPVMIALGISISYMQGSYKLALDYHQNGAGYTSRSWRNSQTIQAIQQLPPDISLISNESALVYFYTNRPAYDISELTEGKPQSFTAYGADPTDPAQDAFRSQGAALILFNSSYWQFNSIYLGQTDARLRKFTEGLYRFAQLDDGSIYFYSARSR